LVALRDSIVADHPESASEEQFMINQHSIDTYCLKFHWDEAKYPIKTPLRSIVALMQTAASKVDEGTRQRQTEWNAVVQTKAMIGRKKEGTLRDKDIDDTVVKVADVIESENLGTLFVIVASAQIKTFLAKYETMAQFVVPRSAKEVAHEGDETLYRVVMFKRTMDDFRVACREQRFTVREFTQHTEVVDDDVSVRDHAKTRKTLLRWAKANFAEVFSSWVHIKGVRLFAESVLRYGPPARYETMLIVPYKKELKNLRAALQTLYNDLSATSMVGGDDDDDAAQGGQGTGQIFPYVQVCLDLDLGAALA
jgi:V-type H+-transporting ATPase subunit C